jgi:hypothetical protein
VSGFFNNGTHGKHELGSGLRADGEVGVNREGREGSRSLGDADWFGFLHEGSRGSKAVSGTVGVKVRLSSGHLAGYCSA